MPEVNVEIAGKKYRMACEEGEEPHLLELAADLNRRIDSFKGSFGEIGDARLTVMAAIAVTDELSDAERRIEELSVQIAEMTAASRTHSDKNDALARDLCFADDRLERDPSELVGEVLLAEKVEQRRIRVGRLHVEIAAD